MKKLMFMLAGLCLSISISSAQGGPAFTQVFRSLGLTPQDVSVTEKLVQAGNSFSFSVKQVPGYTLFVWLESSDTMSNVLLKPSHNFQVKADGFWTSHVSFPKRGLWHVAVFFVPEGTSQMLNGFSFSVNASDEMSDEQADIKYKKLAGETPE